MRLSEFILANREPILAEWEAFARTCAPASKITIDARGGQRGEWDCDRISQALTNPVVNAVEHGNEGAEVTVTVGGDDKEALVAIHNRGVTISAEQLNGIFGPMKSRDAATRPGSSPYGNLGLGLDIAERIVTAHKGHIEVDSSPERGTTFTIHLPAVSVSSDFMLIHRSVLARCEILRSHVGVVDRHLGAALRAGDRW